MSKIFSYPNCNNNNLTLDKKELNRLQMKLKNPLMIPKGCFTIFAIFSVHYNLEV